jgi:hypothetical protein
MKKDFIEKVRDLNLPDGQFMVCGSGILEVLGIREADDIDLLLSPELFCELRDKRRWLKSKKIDTTIVHPKCNVEAKQSLDFLKENYVLSELLPTAYIHGGIPFANLETLKNAKLQLAREKDFKDIKLIDEYLKKNSVC